LDDLSGGPGLSRGCCLHPSLNPRRMFRSSATLVGRELTRRGSGSLAGLAEGRDFLIAKLRLPSASDTVRDQTRGLRGFTNDKEL
jgi:hypothetical protein